MTVADKDEAPSKDDIRASVVRRLVKEAQRPRNADVDDLIAKTLGARALLSERASESISERSMPGATPWEPGRKIKGAVEHGLQRVVDAAEEKAGLGTAAAAVASVPMAVVDLVVPETVGELQMSVGGPKVPKGKGGAKVISLAERRAKLEAINKRMAELSEAGEEAAGKFADPGKRALEKAIAEKRAAEVAEETATHRGKLSPEEQVANRQEENARILEAMRREETPGRTAAQKLDERMAGKRFEQEIAGKTADQIQNELSSINRTIDAASYDYKLKRNQSSLESLNEAKNKRAALERALWEKKRIEAGLPAQPLKGDVGGIAAIQKADRRAGDLIDQAEKDLRRPLTRQEMADIRETTREEMVGGYKRPDDWKKRAESYEGDVLDDADLARMDREDRVRTLYENDQARIAKENESFVGPVESAMSRRERLLKQEAEAAKDRANKLADEADARVKARLDAKKSPASGGDVSDDVLSRKQRIFADLQAIKDGEPGDLEAVKKEFERLSDRMTFSEYENYRLRLEEVERALSRRGSNVIDVPSAIKNEPGLGISSREELIRQNNALYEEQDALRKAHAKETDPKKRAELKNQVNKIVGKMDEIQSMIFRSKKPLRPVE